MPAPQEVTALTDSEGEVVEGRAAVYGMAPQGLVKTKGCIEGEAVTKKARKVGTGAKKKPKTNVDGKWCETDGGDCCPQTAICIKHCCGV